MSNLVSRPTEGEYISFYAGYIQRVPDGDVFDLLAKQPQSIRDTLAHLTPEQENFRPGPAEWTIKEVVGHMIDTERVMSYRALRVSRADKTPLAGFEQDDYVRESNFSVRTLADLFEEFELVRRANILAFNRLTADAYLRTGTANNGTLSVRALIYIMAGHVEHHLYSLRTDYLPKMS